MEKNTIYVGLDVHKDTVAIGEALEGRTEPEFGGTIENSTSAVKGLIRKYEKKGLQPVFCYEAGPTGYGIQRFIESHGSKCVVIAPSLIPTRKGARVQTDRRDAMQLARLYRSGELTEIVVPDEELEAVRDLIRARDDAKKAEKCAKQTLGSFLLRHDKRFPGKCYWTDRHRRWIRELEFSQPLHKIVRDEYLEAVENGERRTLELEKKMRVFFQEWKLKGVAEAIMALRGLDLLTSMTVVSELGDFRRFSSPRKLMGFVGLVPSEFSSGKTRAQGGITKAGNTRIRRLLIESAWSARAKPSKTGVWKRRTIHASPAIQDIAWKAQKRLHERYWRLTNRQVKGQKVVTAIAREFVGFIWAAAQQYYLEEGQQRSAA